MVNTLTVSINRLKWQCSVPLLQPIEILHEQVKSPQSRPLGLINIDNTVWMVKNKHACSFKHFTFRGVMLAEVGLVIRLEVL